MGYMATQTLSASHDVSAADYNPIAGFYHRHWSSHYHPWAIALLERTLLRRLPAHARILDVCCGNGVLARELTRRGFLVTGLDASAEMLRLARANSPQSEFVLADARSFQLPPEFDAALSTFDSLNHILSAEELDQVFRSVRGALRDGGAFLFDVNLEESYRKAWRETCSIVTEDDACFIRGSYDEATRLGRTEITLFEQHGGWSRRDLVLLQRFHPAGELRALLHDAGFRSVRAYDAIDDLGIEGRFGEGRAVFLASA